MKYILGRLRRCVEDYNMIQEGDRIAVGISGGKDSLTALLAMKRLQSFYNKNFSKFPNMNLLVYFLSITCCNM